MIPWAILLPGGGSLAGWEVVGAGRRLKVRIRGPVMLRAVPEVRSRRRLMLRAVT
jgi:hypothetical protein